MGRAGGPAVPQRRKSKSDAGIRQRMGTLQVAVGTDQFLCVSGVPPLQGMLHVFDDHRVELDDSLRARQERLADFGGDGERDVLMLGDCGDFTFIEVAIIENVL